MPEHHSGRTAQSKVSMFRDAALRYAENGWPVFPCNPLDKRPLTSHGFKDATTDPDIIKQWWEVWPNAMIGVPMGEASDVFCVDLDRKEGVDGVGTWSGLLSIHGATANTRIHTTPSTGRHLVYLYEHGVRNIPLGKLGPGIEIKGEGGYIIVPPSRMADGKEYVGNDVDPVEAPSWLLDMINNYLNRDPELEAMLKEDSGKGIHKEEQRVYEDLTADEITEALKHIPADDYEDWFKMAGAIYRALGASGYSVFETWSRKSKKFDARACRQKWRKAPGIRSVGPGSIIYWANQAFPGWREQWQKSFPTDEPQKLKNDKKAGDKKEDKKEEAKTETKAEESIVLYDEEFVPAYKPPAYLISGMLQKRFVYSMTGMTGSGKTCVALRLAAHVVMGQDLCGRKVKKGKVLYFAGENPDDVRVRWIKLCETMEIPHGKNMLWLVGVPPLKNVDIKKKIYAAVKERGPVALVIIDTSAAYFQGDDENSNVQLGEHARMLRTFVHLPGGPTILVTCHPTKNPDPTNLLPRGGGAFLNEVDGNLSCNRDNQLIEIDTHGKFRGPEFAPLLFKLNPVMLNTLKDEDDNPVWSVITVPITDAEHTTIQDSMEKRREELMQVMLDNPGLSLAEYAVKLGWETSDGKPNRRLVQRLIDKLVHDKMAEKKGGHYSLTRKVSNDMRAEPKTKPTKEQENLI
jgi:hypothetical protein